MGLHPDVEAVSKDWGAAPRPRLSRQRAMRAVCGPLLWPSPARANGQTPVTEEVVLQQSTPDVDGYATGRVEVISWQREDGASLSGLLIHPTSGADPAPLVVDVHGGPQGGSTWPGQS